MIVKPSILLSVLLCFSVCSCGPERSVEDRMQKILDKEIKKHNVHGVSATVIFPDGKIWSGVSGVSHDTVPVNPDMLFAIGSITKNVIAALTLNLAEENVLSLDDPISKWLPKYPHIDGSITVRQLLNHTSGIYMFWDNDSIWDALKDEPGKKWTPDDVLSYIKEPHFKPGEGWRYSNTNYLLLAMIITKATGSNLSTELKKHFWQPLGFNNVYLWQEETVPADQLAHVYGDNFQFGQAEMDVTFMPREAHESITYGSSGIFTTSETLARWAHALLGGKVLKQSTMEEMLEFIDFYTIANMTAYGLGVQKYPRGFAAGEYAIGHGGGNIGTSTYMVYFPDHRVSIVVMINAFPNRSLEAITKGLIRVVLRDINAIGIIPYIEFFPTGFLILCITISVSSITISILRKRRKTARRT